MEVLDNLTEMATDLTESVAATSKSLAEEGGIKKAPVELGKLYYPEHGATPEAGYAAACEKISAAKAAIQANNDRIAELKAEAKAAGEVIDDAEIQDAVEAEIVAEEAAEAEAAPEQEEAPEQETKPEE